MQKSRKKVKNKQIQNFTQLSLKHVSTAAIQCVCLKHLSTDAKVFSKGNIWIPNISNFRKVIFPILKGNIWIQNISNFSPRWQVVQSLLGFLVLVSTNYFQAYLRTHTCSHIAPICYLSKIATISNTPCSDLAFFGIVYDFLGTVFLFPFVKIAMYNSKYRVFFLTGTRP